MEVLRPRLTQMWLKLKGLAQVGSADPCQVGTAAEDDTYCPAPPATDVANTGLCQYTDAAESRPRSSSLKNNWSSVIYPLVN